MGRKKRMQQAAQAAAQARAEWAFDTSMRARRYARWLAVTLASGELPSIQLYDIGLVLREGEQVLHRCPIEYCWRGTVSWTEQTASANGRYAAAHERTEQRVFSDGQREWIITDRRLVTRRPDGTVVAWEWAGVNGVTVDLDAEVVALDGTRADGTPCHGEWHGPAAPPIAVAAIAFCFGSQALLDHPALSSLRVRQGVAERHPTVAAIKNTDIERPIEELLRRL